MLLKEAKVENRIPWNLALALAKEIIKKLGLKYIAPDEVGPTMIGRPNCGIPVGSIRQEKSTIGDIDILATKQITESDVEKIDGVKKMTSRGSSQIFFDYEFFV